MGKTNDQKMGIKHQKFSFFRFGQYVRLSVCLFVCRFFFFRVHVYDCKKTGIWLIRFYCLNVSKIKNKRKHFVFASFVGLQTIGILLKIHTIHMSSSMSYPSIVTQTKRWTKFNNIYRLMLFAVCNIVILSYWTLNSNTHALSFSISVCLFEGIRFMWIVTQYIGSISFCCERTNKWGKILIFNVRQRHSIFGICKYRMPFIDIPFNKIKLRQNWIWWAPKAVFIWWCDTK